MTVPIWQQKFTQKLTTKPEYQPQIPKMLFYSKENHRAKAPLDCLWHADDLTSSNRFHIIDLNTIMKQSTKTLEQVLSQDLYDNAIITHNGMLAKAQMSYHALLLDGSQDYLYHYYPKQIAKMNLQMPYQEREKQMTQILYQPTLYSLVLVNDNGSYFLALPCFLNDQTDAKMYKTRDTPNIISFKHFETPIIKITLKTINMILKPFKFLTIDKTKLLTLTPFYHDHSSIFSMSNAPEFACMGFSYDQLKAERALAYNTKKANLQDKIRLKDNFYATKEIKHKYQTFFKRDFLAAINENVTLNLPDSTTVKITFSQKSTYWEHYAKIAVQQFQDSGASITEANLMLALKYNIDTADSINSLTTNWADYLTSLLLQKMLCSWEFNFPNAATLKYESVKASQVISMPVNNKPKMKPLTKGAGLQQFITTLLLNSEHQYFLQKLPQSLNVYGLTTLFYQPDQQKLIVTQRKLI